MANSKLTCQIQSRHGKFKVDMVNSNTRSQLIHNKVYCASQYHFMCTITSIVQNDVQNEPYCALSSFGSLHVKVDLANSKLTWQLQS